MILFMKRDKNIIFKKKGDEFFYDGKGKQWYVNDNGEPLDENGDVLSGEFVSKMYYTVDEYIEMYPNAKRYKRFLEGNYGKSMIVRSYPPEAWFLGNVLMVRYVPSLIREGLSKYDIQPSVVVNDGDDMYMRKIFQSDQEAEVGFNELLELAPFNMSDLKSFGYESY